MRESRLLSKKVYILLLALLPGLFFVCLPSLLVRYPDWSENYIKNIYPVISAPYVAITSAFPFSITEFTVVSAAIIAIPLLVFLVVKFVKSTTKGRYLYTLSVICAVLFSMISGLYTMFLGISYTRYPILDEIGLQADQRSVTELSEVTRWLIEKSSAERLAVAEDDHGCMTLPDGKFTSLRDASAAMNRAAQIFPVLSGNNVTPKPVMLSKYWSYTGISGMYFPFYVEANVNIDQPDLDFPVTMCHEISHVRGIARENEANFAAFFACVSSDRADFRYSGYQYALTYCLNDLYFADRETYNSLIPLIPDAIWRDWEKKDSYWKQFDGPVEAASETVNDSFLKANMQEQGIRSYAQVTELIIDFYYKYQKE